MTRSFWRGIWELFQPAPKRSKLIERLMSKPRVAICVGHSRSGDNGATSVSGVSEWDFNVDIAGRVKIRLEGDGIDVDIVQDYHGRSYGSAMRWLARLLKQSQVDIAVELHFNAASPSAEGFEYLHWQTSKNGKRLAQCLLDSHAKFFPETKNRGLKPKGPGSRGSMFLKLTHCPAVITEPFFGTNLDEWNLYSANRGYLADSYANGIANYLNS